MAKTISFHAAGIMRNRQGYLFFGRDGAGKSTICDLSKGARVIHEDKIHLAKKNGKVYMCGPNNKSLHKINRVFFISQAKANRLKNISTAKALHFMLTDTVVEFRRALRCKKIWKSKYIFNFLMDILRSIPHHKLYFKKSISFWKVIDKLEGRTSK